MASQSTYNSIKERVELSESGTLFFPDSFSALGSSDAVRSALVRLCQNNILIRVAQGIYYYPRIDTKWGSGIIPPSIEEIARGIAMREIGQDNITDEQITIINTHLDQVDRDDYNHDIQLAPIWVRNTLLRKTGG